MPEFCPRFPSRDDYAYELARGVALAGGVFSQRVRFSPTSLILWNELTLSLEI